MLAALSWTGLRGQTAVTEITFGPSLDSTNRTAGQITFLNQVSPVTRIEAGSLGTYAFNGASASSVVIRRNTAAGNANTANVYYSYSSVNWAGELVATGRGDTSPTVSEVMLSGDLSQGLRNPFANGSAGTESNIERIDFHFAGGYTVQAGDAVVLFDLENYGNYGDGFRIAAYTSVGRVNGLSNAPTAYAGTGLLVAPNSGGTQFSATGTNNRIALSTSSDGDSLASNQQISILDSNTGTPTASDLFLTGVLITFADLGLSAGQTIYGYSLMAGDVSAQTGADLVNWNNPWVYSTRTDADGWGNADFAGFGGTIARPVPESPLHGAALTSFALLALRLRRCLRRRTG